MISGLSGSHSTQYAQYAAMAKQIDTDDDGQVTKSEFVDGAPKGVSADAAANLFDLLDTQKKGSIQESDLANAFGQLSDATKYLLIQQQQSGQQMRDPKQHMADMFAKLDTDSDGTLSRDEFVAGRPEGVSQDDAGKLFDEISSAAGAKEGDGLSQAQFAQGVEAHRPGGGPGGKPGGGPEQAFDELDTNKDGVVSLEEFLAGKPENVSDDDAKVLFDKLTNGDSQTGLTKEQFVSGMEEQRPPAQAEAAKSDGKTDEMLKQLLEMLQSEDKSATGSANSASATSRSSLEQFLQAMKAYQTASQQAYAATIVSTVQAAA
jgi:Ca2+-binding EF-hand superfamily protein